MRWVPHMTKIITSATMAQYGWTPGAMRRAQTQGRLTRIWPGCWVEAVPAEPAARHRLMVRAALLRERCESVASHASAAVCWGLPVQRIPDVVTLTTSNPGNGHRRGQLRRVGAPLETNECTWQDDVALTTLARTVVDVARDCDFVSAVMTADAALARGLQRGELDQALDRAGRWPGITRAREVARFADGRSESPYESWLRVQLCQMGLAPTPQLVIRDSFGQQLARVDLALEELRLVIEFDGKDKYDVLVTDGRRPADVFRAEKERDRRLREVGWSVLHLSATDVQDPERLRRLVRTAMAQARRNMVMQGTSAA